MKARYSSAVAVMTMSSATSETQAFEVSRWVAPNVGDSESNRAPLSESSIEKLRQDAKDAGYAEGLSAGKQEARALSNARLETLDQIVQQLAAPLTKLDPETLDAMVELSIRVSEALINRELTLDRSLVLEAVSEALEAIPDRTKTLKVFVNPEDLAIVKEAYANSSLAPTSLIVGDQAIARGGALVESGSTLVDAQLRPRLEDLLNDLLQSAESSDN